jgi:uncharacterized lipoprotein YmbA
MRKVMGLIAVMVAVGLGGCAAQQQRAYLSQSPNDRAFPIDAEYMQRVAAVARKRGVDIQWVNPPRLRAAPE